MQLLTVDLKAQVVVLVANRAGIMLIPDLIIIARYLPEDHLGPGTLWGTFHVQDQSRIIADDHKILAFDAHLEYDNWTSYSSTGTLRKQLTQSVCLMSACTGSPASQPPTDVRSHVFSLNKLIYTVSQKPGHLFRSTLRQSRPNKAGLTCPSVRPSVRAYVRTYVHTYVHS